MARQDIAKILQKLALNINQSINQMKKDKQLSTKYNTEN
jgi:hypothetical protein